MNRLPTVNARRVVRALKRAGFAEVRQRGSHLYLYNATTDRLTAVAMHPGDLKRPTLKAIIRQAGLTEEEFRALL